MTVYIYAADCWCESCAEKIKGTIAKEIAEGIGKDFRDKLHCELSPTLVDDMRDTIQQHMDGQPETDYDSDHWPKGPYPDEETDGPQHCGSREECEEAELLSDGSKVGALLGTSLTDHGVDYLNEMLTEPNPSTYQKALHDFWREQFDSYELADSDEE